MTTIASKRNIHKHGQSRSKIYKEWRNMKDRCYNENSPIYHRYGGRGIQVCERWSNFSDFYDDISDLSNFGRPGYSLDRIDNDGDYTLDNVRWATQQEQTNNRSTNTIISYNDETHTLAEWSRELGINYNTLKGRFRHGWPVERAFTKKAKYTTRK